MVDDQPKETLLGLLIFLFIPLVWGIGLSFTDYTPGVPTQFVGLTNYQTLFSDRVVKAATGVVIRYTLAVVPWVVVIPLLLAVPLNRSFRGIGFFRSGVYFPHIISRVVVATVFIYMYRSDGIINEIMIRIYALFGQEWEVIPFLKKSDWALFGVIFVTYFKSTGYYTILYLAGLQNVPFGYASALAIVVASVILLLSVVSLKFSERD